jgi:hypothetical protein
MSGAVFFTGNNMIRNTFLFGKGGSYIHQVPKRIIRCKFNNDIYRLYAFSFWENIAQDYATENLANRKYIIAPVYNKEILKEAPIDGGIWLYSSTINHRLAKIALRILKNDRRINNASN